MIVCKEGRVEGELLKMRTKSRGKIGASAQTGCQRITWEIERAPEKKRHAKTSDIQDRTEHLQK